MSGTLDQARRRSSTSAPSMSGKPRSRMTRSGGLSVAQRSASPPVSASCTVKPSSSRPARRKRRICTSSSTTRTTGLASVIGIDLGLARRRCERQMDRHRGAVIGAGAHGLDLAAVGGDEGLGDPQAETRARRRRRVARAAEEPLAELARSPPPSARRPGRCTDSTTSRPLRLAAIVMGDPVGEYFAALSTICTNACSTRTAST